METNTVFKRILAATGNEPRAVLDAARSLQGLDKCVDIEPFHLDATRPKDVLDNLLHHALDTRADILVMGGRTHVLASRAAMLAPCSVLMVPDHSTLTFDNVLVPVDFSDSSAEAARCAVMLAEKAHGDWKAVTVESADDAWLDWKDDNGRMEQRLAEFLEKATGRSAAGRCMVEPLNRSVVAVDHTGISPAHHIEGADIASTIAQVAVREKASLVVVGTRGRSRSALILLGSVTEHLMQLAVCPVLAVKHAGHLGLVEGILERLREHVPSLTAS